MQTLLTTTTTSVATAMQYERRPDKAKFTPSTLVQTLVYGWLAQPTATVEQLAQMADRVSVAVSPQAIDQRFTTATATLLQSVLAPVCTTPSPPIRLLSRFSSGLPAS